MIPGNIKQQKYNIFSYCSKLFNWQILRKLSSTVNKLLIGQNYFNIFSPKPITTYRQYNRISYWDYTLSGSRISLNNISTDSVLKIPKGISLNLTDLIYQKLILCYYITCIASSSVEMLFALFCRQYTEEELLIITNIYI